jgi:hypothetical protein
MVRVMAQVGIMKILMKTRIGIRPGHKKVYSRILTIFSPRRLQMNIRLKVKRLIGANFKID